MKIQTLSQNLKCPACKTATPLLSCKRVMNFTTNEIDLYCPNCRAKNGFSTFAQWNTLHHQSLEKPAPRPQNSPQRQREPRRRQGRR